MDEAWYDKTLSEEDRLYEEAVRKLTGAVKAGASFRKAEGEIEIKDPRLKAAVLEDSLKVLIAEMHFGGKKPLNEVAKKLGLPLKELRKAKEGMLKEVEAAAIEKYKSETGRTGNA